MKMRRHVQKSREVKLEFVASSHLSHTEAFIHRPLYTQKPLHTDAVLHTDTAQTLFYTGRAL